MLGWTSMGGGLSGSGRIAERACVVLLVDSNVH